VRLYQTRFSTLFSDARKDFHYSVKQVGKSELAAEQNRNQRCFVTIYGKDEKNSTLQLSSDRNEKSGFRIKKMFGLFSIVSSHLQDDLQLMMPMFGTRRFRL
jgi:hypothetical protein